MFNRKTAPPDATLNRRLAAWRSAARSGALSDTVALTADLTLRADPKLKMHGRYLSPKGALLTLEARMQGKGAWLGLHLSLPTEACALPGQTLGYAARFQSQDTNILRASLRSGQGEGFVDHFFVKHILTRPDDATIYDAVRFGSHRTLPAAAPWRELVFFLPLTSFQLSLLDLRIVAL